MSVIVNMMADDMRRQVLADMGFNDNLRRLAAVSEPKKQGQKVAAPLPASHQNGQLESH